MRLASNPPNMLILTDYLIKTPYFPPDRMENIRIEAPDDANVSVSTSDGIQICGRVVDGATSVFRYRLESYYCYAKDDEELAELRKRFPRLRVLM